jgi:hypothetical protein
MFGVRRGRFCKNVGLADDILVTGVLRMAAAMCTTG